MNKNFRTRVQRAFLISIILHGLPCLGETFRVAQFNIRELTSVKIAAQGSTNDAGGNQQLRNAAEIIQRVRPDILVINEIDFDAESRRNAALFQKRYLAFAQKDQLPISFEHMFFAPVNTGVPTGLDLNNDGKTDGPEDAYGFGQFAGQYGMAVYSRFPIDVKAVRTFQTLLWKNVPANNMPDGRDGKPDFYSAEEIERFRLSSKSHWDVPVNIGKLTIHLLVAHPTPPVFDGPEDANGRRNYDEIRLWADYIAGNSQADYLVDDAGVRGGLQRDATFIIAGDLNADPVIAEPVAGQRAIDQLLRHPRVQDPAPRSDGAKDFEGRQQYVGDKSLRTAGFGRADYLLPSRDLRVAGSGVFWPRQDDPAASLVHGPHAASDHHLVWIDIELP